MGGWRSRITLPQIVIAVLVVVGIVGGTLVYRAGGRIREQDRAAYLAWESDAQPHVERARAMHAALPDLASRARALDADPAAGELEDLQGALVKTRATLETARNRIQTVRVPRVLETVAATYLEAIARALQAVTALQDIAGDPQRPRAQLLALYDTRFQTAAARFAEGDQAREQLRARLKFEATSETASRRVGSGEVSSARYDLLRPARVSSGRFDGGSWVLESWAGSNGTLCIALTSSVGSSGRSSGCFWIRGVPHEGDTPGRTRWSGYIRRPAP